jgi:hypothetical protein
MDSLWVLGVGSGALALVSFVGAIRETIVLFVRHNIHL